MGLAVAVVLVALCAVHPSAASARPTGVIYDPAKTTVWNDLTTLDKAAVEDFMYGIGRGDYSPWTAADVGGSRVPEDVGNELIRHFRSIPSSATGAEAVQSELSAGLQRSGMWPRFWQAIGGASRTAGVRVATRAVPLVAGGFLLWEIGCQAGLLCHSEKVRITPQQLDTVRWRFSGSGVGSNGTCASASFSSAGWNATNASGACPAHNIARNPGSQTVSNQPVTKLPPNVLALEATPDNGAHWYGMSTCSTSDWDWDNTYYFGSSLVTPSGLPQTGCTLNGGGNWEPDHSITGLSVVNDTMTNGLAITEASCGQDANNTPCFKTHYRAGTRGWYLDPGTTRTLEPPRTGTDPLWPADTGTATKVGSDMPARPPRGGATQDAIGQALADSPSLRKETVWVLNKQAPESDPSWSVTPVNSSPAVGVAVIPSCTGMQVAVCTDLWQGAGFTGAVTTTVVQPEQADLTKPAGAILTQSPVPGVEVDLSSGLTVATNPDAEHMPVLVPNPGAHETYAQYIARLQAAGLLGHVVPLADSAADPAYGPDEVVRTNPRPGTRVQPGTEVTVVANPTTAADAGTGTGDGGILGPPWSGSCDVNVNAIDLGPLRSIPLGNVFPFGIVTWLLAIFGGWEMAATPPAWTVHLFGSSGAMRLSTEALQPLVSHLRPVFLCLALVGFTWFLASLTLGRGTGGDEA